MTPASAWQPRRPALWAGAIFIAATLVVGWPGLLGQFLAGPASDQFVAGYGFRLFAADYFREYGAIPQWNPYLFGGLPFIAAMHGDVFYPTAWLRWILPTDVAMTLGFLVHIALAGMTMYAFLRALRVSWVGAVVGGIAWQLSGIVAGMVHPGHDGKLFVSALTPLLFLAILRLVRDRQVRAAGLLGLATGLSLHGHPQLSYYLLVAGALWGAWLVWLAPAAERPGGAERLQLIGLALAGVALGFGVYAVQALPFSEYIPFSPRAEGGASGGWEYATAYSLPWAELISAILPEFNGLKDAYWGTNFLKHHTEYLGVTVVGLAVFGIRHRDHRPLVLVLGGIATLFLLVALGGHTPFYRLWYEVMPLMKKVRAPGMAWFLVAFPVAAFAGLGADRLARGLVAPKRVLVVFGGLAALGLLGAAGILQAFAEALATDQRMGLVIRNQQALQGGGVRVLILALAGGGLIWAAAAGRLRPALLGLALPVMVVADLWSIERQFFVFQPPATETYRDDEITTRLRQTPMPYRVLDFGVYPGSWLMAHEIPSLLGYHGNELRWFDDLAGGKNVWANITAPVLLDRYAVRYLILDREVELPPEWGLVAGPVMTAAGGSGVLYEREDVPPWALVVPGAARVPEEQIVPTLLDPRFPHDRVVLLPDTVSVVPAPLDSVASLAPGRAATVSTWQPGAMTITLAEPTAASSWLLVSETWHPDWRARVDGAPVATVRGQAALIAVPLPAGAREVRLEFASEAYQRGKWISWVALTLLAALLVGPWARWPKPHG